MKAQQVVVLLLAACIVCCSAHRDPSYGEDYDNGKPYKDGRGYNKGGKQYSGDKDYYEGKEDYYKGGKSEYKDKDEYYEGKDEYYGEEKYNYDPYDGYNYRKNDPKDEPDYGPVYNPKAYDNYEYDRYKTEYPDDEYPENEYPEGYEGYGDGGYDGYGYGGVPCDNPHKWPGAWATTYTCVNPYSGVSAKYNATSCTGLVFGTTKKKICLQWGEYSCTFELNTGGKPCRRKAGPCDVEETCNGLTATCPADGFLPGNKQYLCKRAEGPCETNAYCKGGEAKCTPDYSSKKNQTCSPDGPYGKFRPKQGPCDAVDICDGKGPQCPDTKSTDFCGKESDVKGGCDLRDKCNGKDNTCPDTVKPKGEICNDLTRQTCILGGRCDGKAKECPKVRHAPIGSPCRADSLLEEAFYDGKVALKSKYSKEHANMHGWVECDRCYEGECLKFKWEYWNADKDGDHKSSGSHSGSHSSSGSHKSSGSHSSSHKYSSKSGHKSGSKSTKVEALSAEESEVLPADGFYPTKLFETLGLDKATIQSDYADYGHSDGHKKATDTWVPEVYCHNPWTNKDYRH